MSAELWKSVQDLAEAWREQSAVEQVLSRMPSRHKPPQTGLAERIEMLQAGGVPCRPLLMGYAYDLASQLYESAPAPAGVEEWLQHARVVQHAYLTQLGWIRAQLPGYPMLRLPQLVRGAPLMSSDITRDLPWYAQHLSAGFQTMSHPPSVLGESTRLRDATREVVVALTREPHWAAFAAAQDDLLPADLEALRAVNTELRQKVNEDAVNAFEPMNLSRRQEFRSARLRESIEELTGNALTYATAFDSLNELMTIALDYVLNYLVEFDRVEEAAAITDIDIDGEDVEFSSSSMFARTRSLVYLPDSAIDEGGFVTMVAFAMDNEEARFRIRVRLLQGLREGLRL